ncbi:MAG: tRNA (5-methylaminomethyl-2-thiouridine)(34)-methyltransferase MnmD [Pseudomonadota bacterium]
MSRDISQRQGVLKPVALTWSDNDMPIATAFDDPYYAREDGRAESHTVFVAGNGLPERWRDRPRFTIAELGFGTGLNFFETWHCWVNSAAAGGQLHYISFELWPLEAEQIARAIARWPDLIPLCMQLTTHWQPRTGVNTVTFSNVELTVIVGDARPTVPAWDGKADAWYLDGFSPAANPELWDADLMREVCNHTVPGGTFSTYTAAGWVRRNLIAAGFHVDKVPGYGRKRERLQGRRPVTT